MPGIEVPKSSVLELSLEGQLRVGLIGTEGTGRDKEG